MLQKDECYHTLKNSNLPNRLTVTAFDSEGKVLSMSKYEYAD